MTEEESLEAQGATLEAAVADLQERLDRAVNRDIPLLKGTVRASLDADINEIGELPDARAFNRRVETHAERLDTIEEYVAALGGVGTTQMTEEEKLAAICHFAQNKRGQRSTVAVTADEI